jgi:protein involved in polysaccharide export with SLBB domain
MAGTRSFTWCALSVLVGTLSLAGGAEAQNEAHEVSKRTASARVRPGDRVVMNFLRDRELSGEVSVNERGDAAFPKIGVLHVIPFTIGQLQDTLRARYSEFLRVPEMEVAVLRRIIVNGEVRIPNVYMVDGTSTVRDAIARAGGITETGNRKNVVIMREGDRIPVKGWEREQGPAYDLQSGDQIIVGRKNWLVMNALSVISTAVLVTSFVLSVSR